MGKNMKKFQKRFKDIRENVEDDERKFHPRSHRTDKNVEKVLTMVHSDRRLAMKQAYYVEILKRLHEAVRRKRPELWPNDWILHHDNVPVNKVLPVKNFLAKKWITEMEYPPSSPHLAPNGLWLFPQIKSALKGRRFQDSEDIQKCDNGTESYFIKRSCKDVSKSGSIAGLST
jgi:hypothetical protein